jgi:hypothetical protein
MTESSPNPGPETALDAEALLRSLRRKEGGWVDWGHACQTLQKAGHNPQDIFEATGFEPIQQNQIITATQVYGSLLSGAAAAPVLEHFQQRGSDILYEFRVLNQIERVKAATLAYEKKIDADEAREVTKAIKDFTRIAKPPSEFTDAVGDAVAYQCWRIAREQADLQQRSRLIARGLSYAQSEGARQQLEKLLTDFTIIKTSAAPRLPLYRLDSEEDLPRIIPVLGRYPLKKSDLQTVPMIEEQGAFKLVQFSGTCAWVPVPGWQVILSAQDPIGLLCQGEVLDLPNQTEEVLVIVDRDQRQWQDDSYFLVAEGEQLEIRWFATEPEATLLGRMILVLRPKQILDESVTLDPWQIDE